MTYKMKLFFIMSLFALLLTGCGAKVHTETSFAKDGSGKRIIFLEIASKDEGQIEGGFQKLDSVLQKYAPSCIKVSRHEDSDLKEMVYELKYDFTDIEDFRNKTKQVTGKENKIEWEQKQGAFAGMVSYSDDTTTGELVQWVKEALQKENINSAVVSRAYEELDSKVSYEGENVWTGKTDANFKIDSTPSIQDISVFTTYDEDGEVTKEIKLGFSYGDYMTMDTEEGLRYLKDFSKDFKVDTTCNGYSVTLQGVKSLKKFFKKASGEAKLDIAKEDMDLHANVVNCYFENNSTKSIFSNRIEMKEVYNMNVLLSGFRVSAKTIKDYVSIPKRESYTRELVHHTYGLQSTSAYNYIGEYDVSDTYYLCFTGGDSVEVKSASVVYSVDENLMGNQIVTLIIDKHSMRFGSSDVMEYYSGLGEKVQYQEDGKSATITFTKTLNEEDKEELQQTAFSFYRRRFQLRTSFSLRTYFPIANKSVRYTVNLPSAFRVDSFSFGDTSLNQKKIKGLKQDGEWTFSTDMPGSDEVHIGLAFSRANMIFYGVLGMVILLLIGAGLSVYFYCKRTGRLKHKGNKKAED